MVQSGNLIEELKADHRAVQDMFDQINALAPGGARRRDIADDFTIELVQHAIAEEMYFYPAVRQYVTGSDAMADKEIADHAKVEEMLTQLEALDADRREFDTLVAGIISEVVAHVTHEEGRLMPAQATACSPEQLNKLGEKIRSAKAKNPTRPHPNTPSTTPTTKLLAPGTGLVHRARDMLSGRGRS
jgi:hemerythrin superfamily protein